MLLTLSYFGYSSWAENNINMIELIQIHC